MVLSDVNVLVYAHRRDALRHAEFRRWVEEMIDGDQAYGVSSAVLAGFVRVVTHPRVFDPPSTIEDALAFAGQVRGQPNCIPVEPGERHWEIFERLCRAVAAKGGLAYDTHLAALAIEHGCEWITTDRDFSRFKGLRWRHPLE